MASVSTLEKRVARLEADSLDRRSQYLTLCPLGILIELDKRNAEDAVRLGYTAPVLLVPELDEDELLASAEWAAEHCPDAVVPHDVWIATLEASHA